MSASPCARSIARWGTIKIPFNLYVIQVGRSGTGRKGTSAAIADVYLDPAIRRLAGRIQAQIAFTHGDDLARDEAETEVEATARKLGWTRNVDAFHASEIEIELDTLKAEQAACAQEIADRKTHLESKTFGPDTVRKYEKLIAAAQEKQADIAGLIIASEAELAMVRAALKNPAGALAQAKWTMTPRRRGSTGSRRPRRRPSHGSSCSRSWPKPQ